MNVRAVIGLLAVGLATQATYGKLQVTFEGVHSVDQEDGHPVGFANVLKEANIDQADITHSGDRALQSSLVAVQSGHRDLLSLKARFKILGFSVTITFPPLRITVTGRLKKAGVEDLEFVGSADVDEDGEGTMELDLDEDYLNDDQTGLCDTCSIEAEAGECTEGECDGYDQEGSNLDVTDVEITGDPHMVGLLGQKIDWAGVDSAWYCLLSDGPDFHVNVRLSAPMPVEFPDRQLISAVSILSDNGRNSFSVEVKNPYSTKTHGCPEDASVPCLADGGLRFLVDGKESFAMQSPIEKDRLPGSSPVVVSSANLPAECRPFGGDRIWATQFSDMMANHRRLRVNSVSFDEWILQPVTLAAPTWCAKFLEEGGSPGLLSTRSEHATLRVETPFATVRINVGVNYQDLETTPDGTVVIPELEFWQTDLGFDGLQLSDDVAGLMGDTSRYVLDGDGMPVTSGLGALHGPVESYRVAGPFSRDFERLHQ